MLLINTYMFSFVNYSCINNTLPLRRKAIRSLSCSLPLRQKHARVQTNFYIAKYAKSIALQSRIILPSNDAICYSRKASAADRDRWTLAKLSFNLCGSAAVHSVICRVIYNFS